MTVSAGDRVRLLDPADHAPMVGFSMETQKRIEKMVGRVVVLGGDCGTFFRCGQKWRRVDGIAWPVIAMEAATDEADEADAVPLAKIRRRLGRSMTKSDRSGCEFTATFGGRDRLTEPHVSVRVGLRGAKGTSGQRLEFTVAVDVHGPMGADAEAATKFSKALGKAAAKARWAEKIVTGLSWSRDEVLEGVER